MSAIASRAREYHCHSLERLGLTVALANNQFLLAEGLLVAGRLQDAGGAAGRALRVAHTAGPKAGALHVLCEVARLSDPPDVRCAIARQREALAITSDVRMRPLAARCHLALGRALATSGDLEPARERLTTAGSMFEDRGMRFWLEQTTSELYTVGRTKHAAQG